MRVVQPPGANPIDQPLIPLNQGCLPTPKIGEIGPKSCPRGFPSNGYGDLIRFKVQFPIKADQG
jgi:hypothetical protein